MKNNQGFTLIELMMVITIIGILASVAIESYMPCRVKARIISIVGPFATVKTDAHVYHALHGTWPKNSAQALTCSAVKSYNEIDEKYDVLINDGAIHFKFKEKDHRIKGDMITLRPVIDNNYPDGPIHWICGNKKDLDTWHLFGIDRTNFDTRYIPREIMQ